MKHRFVNFLAARCLLGQFSSNSNASNDNIVATRLIFVNQDLKQAHQVPEDQCQGACEGSEGVLTGWTLLLEVTKLSSRMLTCHTSPWLPGTGAWSTFLSSGKRRSWPRAAQPVTPWTVIFVACVDKMSRKTPATLQTPWWWRSWRWWSPSTRTPWQRSAVDPGRGQRPWWRLAVIFV